jgi:hypothetical protein
MNPVPVGCGSSAVKIAPIAKFADELVLDQSTWPVGPHVNPGFDDAEERSHIDAEAGRTLAVATAARARMATAEHRATDIYISSRIRTTRVISQ